MLYSGWKTCRKSKWSLKIKVEGAGRNHVSSKELTFHLITEIRGYFHWNKSISKMKSVVSAAID